MKESAHTPAAAILLSAALSFLLAGCSPKDPAISRTEGMEMDAVSGSTFTSNGLKGNFALARRVLSKNKRKVLKLGRGRRLRRSSLRISLRYFVFYSLFNLLHDIVMKALHKTAHVNEDDRVLVAVLLK